MAVGPYICERLAEKSIGKVQVRVKLSASTPRHAGMQEIGSKAEVATRARKALQES